MTTKKIKVHTFYYPQDKLFLAYTTYQGVDNGNRVIYEVEAKNGNEAKKIALKMRKEKERGRR